VAVFITLEGGEGAGKSTQAQLLTRRIQAAGMLVVGLREPGGTPLGDYLRDWLKSSREPLTAEAELLLFTAARAELVRTTVRPALEEGRHVVLDRYADSTTAYQGSGRRLPMRLVNAANRLATGGLVPRMTILLDAPPELTMARANDREGEAGTRRFENADLAFHRRVRASFRRLARRSPERWLMLDALAPIEATHAAIWARVERLVAG
jgi:dTMP kinase